tara:strand:+ start:1867 stop:3732 length:1866 start_codon:yes stop_codon:yes gene_type:complete
MATLEELKQRLEAEEALIQMENERKAQMSDSIADLKLERAQLEKGTVAYRAMTAQIAEELQERSDLNAQIKQQTEDLKAQTKAYQENEKVVAKTQDQLESLAGGFLSLNTKMGKMAQGMSNGDISLSKFAKSGKAGEFALGQLKAAGAKVVDMFIEFGMQQDKVLANFRAQTGAGDEFNEVIRTSALDNIALGVTLEETAGAVRELKNEYTDFTYLNEQQQRALTNTTTMLNKLGMSFSTQASIMQTATQAMGMDVKQANNLLVDLASTAQSLGVDVEKLGQQFAQNADFLVRFGEDGKEVFEEMAVAAKALGTEMSTLVKVTDKFKTFDEAGRSVGRFNAILGGPFLNSMDMLNASYEDPIAGIQMLREGFEQAGKSVEDLSGAELEAFASALGLSTTETVELLGKSNEELELQRKTQEEMAEAARKAQPVMDQLSMAFKTLLADGKPLIDVFVHLLGYVGDFAKFIGSAENAMGKFVKIGMAAAGIAALVGAPFTGGASLITYGAIAGTAGLAAFGGGGGGGGGGGTPHFATGGTVTTEQAIVHPGEMLITGGQGTEVVSQKDFKELLDGLKKMTASGVTGGSPIQIAVYIGRKKIDDVVVEALNSPTGRKVITPYSMV